MSAGRKDAGDMDLRRRGDAVHLRVQTGSAIVLLLTVAYNFYDRLQQTHEAQGQLDAIYKQATKDADARFAEAVLKRDREIDALTEQVRDLQRNALEHGRCP